MTVALVTGGTGFIGGHLVEALLQRGYRVRCMVRDRAKARGLQELGAELVAGSLLDATLLAEALGDVSVVFHVAGAIAARNYAEFHAVNVEGTRCLAEACARQTTPPTLILVSSVAASGPIARNAVRTENQSPAPISDYGRSKLAGEEAARALAAQVPITIVRPGVVFGPRDRSSLAIFSAIQYSGLHAYPRWRSPPLSVIYVGDLVELLILAAEHGQRLVSSAGNQAGNGNASLGRGVYFAVREEHPTYREFGWLAAQALGRRWYVPLPLVPPLPLVIGGASQWIARMRGKASIVNLDKMREATVPSWACSPEQAERELGFAPSAPLLEQLRKTVAWYRAERWL